MIFQIYILYHNCLNNISHVQARGKVNCSTCEGTTHIRSHIQLSVSWRLVTSEHISTKLSIPENLIRNVSGQVAFEEEFPKVEPVTAFKASVEGLMRRYYF